MKKRRTTGIRHAGGEKQTSQVGRKLILGVLTALVFTAACILVIAFLIKSMNLPDSAIHPINIAVKMLAAMLAAFVATRSLPSYTWAVGSAAGVLYTLVGYVLIALLDGGFGHLALLLGDVVMGAIVGFATGILAQMMPKKKAVIKR